MKEVPLVSVIVPAFNAEDTITATLESAAEQSWSNLEIVIVDDGSNDATAERGAEFCRRDSRARMVRQANGGVAAARNAGIAESRGEWIAPLDADDLWHPLKIEWQMAAAREDPQAGLIYSWSRMIDSANRVIGTAPVGQATGDVLAGHLLFNFVGNGSTALISRSALGALRYDSRVDGCADYLLQLRLAARTRFAHVPAFLTAYRNTGRNMSADALRMIEDHVRLFEILIPDLPPEHRAEAVKQLARWRTRLALVLLRRWSIAEASAIMAAALATVPGAALVESFERIRCFRGRDSVMEPGRFFLELHPEEHLA